MIKDLQIIKALIKEIAESAMCTECGGPMYEGMCTECGYMEEVSYDKSGLENPNLADLNKDKDISSYEKKRGAAIEKNMKKEDITADSEARIKKMEDNNKYFYNLGYHTGYSDANSGRDSNPMKENHEGTDHEVSMANNSIDSIIWAAHELKKYLQGGERDIPAWIQDHITNAENYILQAAKNYHEYGSEEAPEETPEQEPETKDMSLSSLMEAKKKPSAGLTKKQKSVVAKKARAGKDIGGKGKGFEKIAKKAAKEYGSAERGRKVAAAAMWKNVKRK